MQSALVASLTGHNQPLDEAVEQAASHYAARNPSSEALYQRAKSVMPGGNTRTSLHFDPFPLYIARSAGAWLTDVDGARYLDALGDFTAGLFGHGDPVITGAIVDAIEDGLARGAPGQGEIALAELMCARFPSLDRVRFCNSGTEANLYALTLAIAASGRKKLIGFSGAYHGGVLGLSPRGNPLNVPLDWTLCRYNDVAATVTAIEAAGPDLAAVIIEPFMSNGGCIAADAAFLRAIREATARVGAALIFDEIVTSRMGPGGLQGIHGIRPDLTTFGKYIGGGLSFGAFGGCARLMDRLDPTKAGAFPHAGTFNNNVATMAAGVAALTHVFTAERAQTLFEDGEALRARLNALTQAVSPALKFTGCGSVMNLHFHPGKINSPDDLADEPADLFGLFHFDMMEAGVYVARRGQINLNLAMGEPEFALIEQAVSAFCQRRGAMIAALPAPA